MAPNKIMLIRHAEKPTASIKGVSKLGAADKEDLIVRGWQRSGALVRLFAPPSGKFADPRLAQPKTIFASALGKGSESSRPRHTVEALANTLDLKLDLRFPKGDEADLAKAVLAATGPALIAWEHQDIPDIINHIVGNNATCPQKWDGKRFDLVWVLDRKHKGWKFSQVPQMLLPGDSEKPIE